MANNCSNVGWVLMGARVRPFSLLILSSQIVAQYPSTGRLLRARRKNVFVPSSRDRWNIGIMSHLIDWSIKATLSAEAVRDFESNYRRVAAHNINVCPRFALLLAFKRPSKSQVPILNACLFDLRRTNEAPMHAMPFPIKWIFKFRSSKAYANIRGKYIERPQFLSHHESRSAPYSHRLIRNFELFLSLHWVAEIAPREYIAISFQLIC